ncbi:MAG: HDOD domain-containing protein [Planctomycetes bacterium]|nr:HDOD domain-containing protein [Planctomycetota bacterium]
MKTRRQLQDVIESMPPLPEVAVQVLALVQDPDFAIEDIVSIVRTDPTLTARLLKLCNSSIYSLASTLTDIRDAVGRLGTRNVVRVVVASCSTHYFADSASRPRALDPHTIWRHALACGVASEVLSERLDVSDPGTAFTSGVLHDIGKVALSQQLGEDLVPTSPLPGEGLVAYERRVFGADHASVAGLVLDRWPVPAEVRRAIVDHHEAHKLLADPPLTAIVHVADLMVLRAGVGAPADGLELEYLPEALRLLGLDAARTDGFAPRFLTELAKIEEMLAV